MHFLLLMGYFTLHFGYMAISKNIACVLIYTERRLHFHTSVKLVPVTICCHRRADV